MTSRLLWCASAILLGLGVHRSAHACSCGPSVGPVMLGPLPANGLFLAAHCVEDVPSEHLRVYVDGTQATIYDTNLTVGDFAALLRIEPTPAEGQTIEIDGCGAGECVPALAAGQWTAGPPDVTPPEASVGSISLSTEQRVSDGLNCPPYGQVHLASLEDFSFSDDVALIRVEAVAGGVVVDGGLSRWEPSLAPSYEESGQPWTVSVYSEQAIDCVRAYALDVAGNETPLGPEDCMGEAPADDGTGVTTAEVDGDGGNCVCASAQPGGPAALAMMLLGLGLLGRRRSGARHPR